MKRVACAGVWSTSSCFPLHHFLLHNPGKIPSRSLLVTYTGPCAGPPTSQHQHAGWAGLHCQPLLSPEASFSFALSWRSLAYVVDQNLPSRSLGQIPSGKPVLTFNLKAEMLLGQSLLCSMSVLPIDQSSFQRKQAF